MDDMTAFERQLENLLQHAAGPSRLVDAMAIARTVASVSRIKRCSIVPDRDRCSLSHTPLKERLGTMFPAIKYVIAGAIVGLFGSFLVTGTLAVAPQPPGGSWQAQDGLYHYRDFPVMATGLAFSDPHWPVICDPTGTGTSTLPVPSQSHLGACWSSRTMRTPGMVRSRASGAADGAPVIIQALLAGEGSQDGLCATLDINAAGMATGDTWLVDGVIYPCLL